MVGDQTTQAIISPAIMENLAPSIGWKPSRDLRGVADVVQPSRCHQQSWIVYDRSGAYGLRGHSRCTRQSVRQVDKVLTGCSAHPKDSARGPCYDGSELSRARFVGGLPLTVAPC